MRWAAPFARVDATLELDGVYRVSAVCDVENVASARVMEKAGMRYAGLTDEYYGLKGMKKYVADRATWRAPA